MLKLIAGPKFDCLNLSKYKMERCISNQDEHIQYNYYYTGCFSSILYSPFAADKWKTRNVVCENCKTESTITKSSSNYFMAIKIAHQLEQILLNERLSSDILKNLSTRNNNNNTQGLITDLSGGKIQKKKIITNKNRDRLFNYYEFQH